jgi:hypothetical protein
LRIGAFEALALEEAKDGDGCVLVTPGGTLFGSMENIESESVGWSTFGMIEIGRGVVEAETLVGDETTTAAVREA